MGVNVIFEEDLRKPIGSSLQKLTSELPTEFIELDEACNILILHGFASDKHDAFQALQRCVQFGLAEWGSQGPDRLHIRRAEITVRSETDRRLLAGRVTLHTANGDFAFNYDPTDPLYAVKPFKKPRWTKEQRQERAKAEADAKRSKPMKLLRKVVGK